ncbi:MAG: hypothetical protein A3K07_01790 [Candidatus Doudnabacteria bacterium RIFCSPHIGHO2_01_43_10]|nr:MAG: hypothetical protein A3K07_01790 [Candidatus Doudnabacteria bacterium RIFCSPHIGHO2_01_43_10]
MLKGLPASNGIIEGIAKVFLPGDDAKEFPQDAIMVTTLTDPTMVMAMMKASAIVTDMGGITSHPAILSREMGIPCIVNTKLGTKLIKDGQRIKVDAITGEIYDLD